MRGAQCLVVIALTLAGCSKGNDPSATGAAPGATLGSETASAAHSSPASSSLPGAPPSAADAPETWSGHYTATPGSISIPDAAEWAGVKFRGDDAGVGLGDGTLTISIAHEGRVHGTLDGPLGPLVVTGELTEQQFAAALVSSQPGRGFSGTATGTRTGDQLAGTMRLSLPTASVVREASFTLERKH